MDSIFIQKIKSYMEYKYIIMKQGGEKTSSYLREKVKRNKVSVGMHTYGGCFHDGFNLGGEVEVGRYCSIGANVHYFGGNHPMNYASMSPYFYREDWWGGGGQKVKDISRHKLKIKNDVWIGFGVNITSNCEEIGNGAVIGVGSIVTKNVEPYAIVAGSPEKFIRYRFDKETIACLEKSKWYELEPEELIQFYKYIGLPKEFAEEVIRYRGV